MAQYSNQEKRSNFGGNSGLGYALNSKENTCYNVITRENEILGKTMGLYLNNGVRFQAK